MADVIPSSSRTESGSGRKLHEVETTAGPPATLSEPVSLSPSLADHPRYRLLELLGAGGMGAVYKAEHRRMERQVTLKVMNPSLMDRPEMVERFHREVKAAARLTHPNIVTAYDADQAGDAHFLIMEFVEGVNLAQQVQRQGALPVAQACSYIRQTALGLQHAFERGMVHRDVKPHNLMLTPEGQVKILDFGLARFVRETTSARTENDAATRATTGAAEGADSTLTEAGAVLGTADFIAPEQAADPSRADIRADIYSLGCTLYYLLAGHAPFTEGTGRDKLIAHAERAPTPLTELRRDVPPALAGVVERMMAKEPSQRYQTPAKVAEALTPFLPEKRSPQRGRRRVAVVAGVCALVLFLGLATYFLPSHPLSLPQGGPEPVVAPAKKESAKHRPIPGEGVPVKYRDSVRKGLAYLARMQKSDGHWEANGGQFPTAITALAGIALLMEGSTLEDGQYRHCLRKAVSWLMERSQPNGLLGDPKQGGDAGRYLFGHGYSMLFLASVYGQEEAGERRRKLEKLLTQAVEFSAKAQAPTGGWGYVAAAEGKNFDELCSTIIQLQGLRAARNVGIVVPRGLLDLDYLRKCTTAQGGIFYSLSNHAEGDRPALTTAALACAGQDDSNLARKWLQFCQKTIPLHFDRRLGHDEFMHYYYAQALYILGDDGYEKLFPASKPAERLTWSKYRETLFDHLQTRQGGDGSWSIGPLGSVYSSICTVTILQLDNATLPIYRR